MIRPKPDRFAVFNTYNNENMGEYSKNDHFIKESARESPVAVLVLGGGGGGGGGSIS